MIQAISLDFWGTLAVFNPEYTAALSQYFAELFGVTEKEARAQYKTTKHRCDHDAENFGTAVTPLIAVKRLIEGVRLTRVAHAPEIMEDIFDLVRKYPPRMSADMPKIIESVAKDFTVGIASNTNFMSGSLMREVCPLPLDFEVYSDEIGVSKPDRDFFYTIVKCAKRSSNRHIHVNNFLHIGDHLRCDKEGAERIGMRAIQIANPEETTDVLRRLCRGETISNIAIAA